MVSAGFFGAGSLTVAAGAAPTSVTVGSVVSWSAGFGGGGVGCGACDASEGLLGVGVNVDVGASAWVIL